MPINWKNLEKEQSRKEEIINSLIHIFGLIFALSGLIFLIIYKFKPQNPLHFIPFLIYGLCLCFLFLMSTLYHGIQTQKIKKYFRILDYVAIFILIAGSYTPIALILFQKQFILSWGLFFGTWIMAAIGSVMTVLWFRHAGIAHVFLYGAMGLFSILLIPMAYQLKGLPIIISCAIGGIFFIIGVYFFGFARFRYHHAIWHLMVMIGSMIHFFTIVNYIS